MQIIYVDNFRGFTSTYLDLKNINFFVGENSTGKTSILKLIGVLSSQDFWRYGDFGKNQFKLGGFSDIITTPRSNRDYFEIGIFYDSFSESSVLCGIRLRFIEQDNSPSLKEISFRTDKLNVQVIIEGKTLKFRHQVVEKNFPFKFETFKNWIEYNSLNEIPFSRTSVEYFGIIPILTQVINDITYDRIKQSKSNLSGESFKILFPQFVDKLAWLDPIRAEPQIVYRHQGLLYDTEGTHSPSVLKDILLGPNVKLILNRFGQDSGLFEDITTRDLFDSEILKSMENAETLSGSETFEILVTINGIERNLVNVGFGLSQILPIIIEPIARQDNTWFVTQQPEVHLHPRAQAALGDFIFKSNTIDSQNFIIETHSDFIVDRFRLRLNRAFRNKESSSNSQIVFFTKTKKGNKLELIEFNADGSYPEEQAKEFREFFIREQLELISI